MFPRTQNFSRIPRKFGLQDLQKNLKKISFSRVEHMKFSFKDPTNGAPDAAGCSPYALMSVA